MKIERPRPAVLQVTLGTYEMATLMAAIRWVLEGREGDLTPGSLRRLEQVLERYDTEMGRLQT